MYKTAHAQRVRKELIEAGASSWGLLKMESRYLPNLLHKDEHIGGIVYGKYKSGSAMLVATNKRVLFLDHKPLFYNISDEISYDVVAGVGYDTAGPYSTITLHTRLGDYPLSFVRTRPAQRFIHFIESKRLEVNGFGRNVKQSPTKRTKKTSKPKAPPLLTADEQAFLLNHDIAALSTIGKDKKPRGSVIYYVLAENNYIYMITKSETQKFHNLSANPDVALTIFDTDKMQVLQIQGSAEIEYDNNNKEAVFQQIVKPRRYGVKVSWPPITKIKEGSYVVVKIVPVSVKFADYK